MTVRVPKRMAGDARMWAEKLSLALRHEIRWTLTPDGRVPKKHKIDDDEGSPRRASLHVAAALISLADDQRQAFRAFKILMFQRRRSGQWREALSRIPADGETVDGIARLVMGYERMATKGRFDSLEDARGLRLAPVVETMVKVSRAPDAFLDAVRDVWCDHPNRVFSDATLREVAPRLRGVLSERSRTPGYRAGVTEGMDVVG